VLDEATSNLDLRSERKVESALDRILEGRTAILVAHRLTTAMRADRVIVIDEGGVVEEGTHLQLLERGGKYAEMFEIWAEHSVHHPAGAPPE
jgi:ATP-binding cassette subfamily B protein